MCPVDFAVELPFVANYNSKGLCKHIMFAPLLFFKTLKFLIIVVFFEMSRFCSVKTRIAAPYEKCVSRTPQTDKIRNDHKIALTNIYGSGVSSRP